jgi:tetratricopeptide (TPR) repeat protein
MIPLKDQAIENALSGNWKSAISTNETLLDENPNDIDALNRLALAYVVLGKHSAAKTKYQKVLQIDPLNPIALKNLKNLKDKKLKNTNGNGVSIQINNKFLEEPGKTKIVELVNIAQPALVQTLRTGQAIDLCIKRLKIFILEDGKQYIGVLPDDIGKRLIRLMKSGNSYEAYIKSANPHKVQVFIKETKRSTRFKNHPSFISNSGESNLLLDKGSKIKNGVRKLKKEETETEDFQEEEESSE